VEELKSRLASTKSPGGDLEIIGEDLDWFDEIENQKQEIDKKTSRRLLGGALEKKQRGEVKTHLRDAYKA